MLFNAFWFNSIGERCVIGHTDVSIAWRSDGSRLYGYELAPRLYRPSAGPFTTDLARLDFGFYNGFDSPSKRRSAERLMPAMFHRRGFAWLDLSEFRSVPCTQDALVDGGLHPTPSARRRSGTGWTMRSKANADGRPDKHYVDRFRISAIVRDGHNAVEEAPVSGPVGDGDVLCPLLDAAAE